MIEDITPKADGLTLDARTISMLRYWDKLRGDRALPGRIDIKPGDILRHLSRIAIVERPRAGTVRMRLVGATLSTRLGMELKGMPFRALFDLDDRSRAMNAAEVAIATPAITIMSLAGQPGQLPEGYLTIFPLSDATGALTRALVLYSDAAGRPMSSLPPRLKIEDTWTIDIPETGPVVTSNADKGLPAAQYVQRNIEADAAKQAVAVTRRAAFRVIKGGKA